MHKSFIALTVMLASVFTASALRADFTIDVPVDVKDIPPSVLGVEVSCQVCKGDCFSPGHIVLELGSGEHLFTGTTTNATTSVANQIANSQPSLRGFTGTIRVQTAKPIASAIDPRAPADTTANATDYFCDLNLVFDRGNGAHGFYYAGSSDDSQYPWARHAPNTPFVPRVKGKAR